MIPVPERNGIQDREKVTLNPLMNFFGEIAIFVENR